MKPSIVLLTCGAFMASAVCGQDDPALATTPSAPFKQRAMQWMTSTDAAKRHAAYRSWLQLEASSMPSYREALDAAATHHSKRLEEICSDRANPYKAFNEPAEKLETERPRVMELINVYLSGILN